MKRNGTLLLVYAAMLLTLGVADAAGAIHLNLQRGRLSIATSSAAVVIELPNANGWPVALVRRIAAIVVEQLSAQEAL